MLIVMLVLSAYIFRVGLSKWLVSDYLGQNARVTCLEFDIGTSPTIIIKSVCLDIDTVSIEVNNASWFLDDWKSKASRLNIGKLTVNHKEASIKTNENETELMLPNMAFPAGLPRITVASLTLQSYLLQQPLNLALQQRTASAFSLTGDVNADLDYLDGTLQGTINWTPASVLAQSPVLREKTAFLHELLNWESLINTKIDSQFVMAGDRIETVHELHMNPQMKLDNCPLSIDAKGLIYIDLTLARLEARIDASDFPLVGDVQHCLLIPAALKNLKIAKVQLTATQPLFIKKSVLSTTGVNVSLLQVQQNPVVTLSDISFGFDQSLSRENAQDLSLAYTFELASNLAELDFLPPILTVPSKQDQSKNAPPINDLALSGALALSSKGKVTKNNNAWTVTSESAELQIHTPSTHFASAERLTNSFQYRVSFSDAEQLKLLLSGQQVIARIKIASPDSPIVKINEIKTDWDITHASADSWQATLSNSIGEVILPETKLVKLTNTSFIVVNPDNKLKLKGQSKLQGAGYTDKKLSKLSFEHELNVQLPNMEVLGKHQLQLESGVNLQIMHTEKDFKLLMPEQQIKPLQNLAGQFNRNIQLVTGTISAEVSGDFSSINYAGNAKLTDTSLKYDDFQVLFLQFNEAFKFNSAGLQLSSGKIKIDEINVGVPIRQVDMVVDIVDSVAKIESAQGVLIGGTFKVSDIWLDGRKQQTNISVSGLDLAGIVALQKQQGIQVTGLMSGVLPFKLGADDGIIEHGLLASDGPGRLKIKDNVAFDTIKSQQEQLSFLQNVEYRKLSSKVELASDGWLDLELSIAGRNPDKKQEVIFNYGHKENIFTLLKSLRISSSIQDSIEKRIKERMENQIEKRKPEKGN